MLKQSFSSSTCPFCPDQIQLQVKGVGVFKGESTADSLLTSSKRGNGFQNIFVFGLSSLFFSDSLHMSWYGLHKLV